MALENNISKQIADFVCSATAEPFPSNAMRIMQLSIMDWVAVSVRGAAEPVSAVVRAMVSEEGGKPEAYAFGHDRFLPARGAALVNGTVSHALDYDDTHFISISHPSVAVIPAALAVADKTNASASDFLKACLLGVEIGCRMGAWLGRDHYRSGFHITSTSGAFGAAIAASALLGLDHQKIVMALNIAASKASGIKAQFGTMGKPFHAGMAASAGVEAALLAQQGFVASTTAIDGAQGYADAHHGMRNQNAFDGLGENYVFENVSHKFHACCHGIHASLEAVMKLQAREKISPSQIKEIAITTHKQWLDVCNISKPQTGLEIKFSYKMAIALAISGFDTASLETYADEFCQRQELSELQKFVTVTGVEEIPETAAVVTITRKDATRMEAHHDLMELTNIEDRQSRLLSKASSLLGNDMASSLWHSVLEQKKLPSYWMAQNANL